MKNPLEQPVVFRDAALTVLAGAMLILFLAWVF